MNSLRTMLLVSAVAAPWVARADGHADGNRVREVTARPDGAKTVITVRGSATPSFTAYRLEQPARLVVDLAGGQLDTIDGPIDVDTWAVGQIGFAQYRASGASTARVMIGLKRSATYDVKAKGNDVVITVHPDEAPPALAAAPDAGPAAREARLADERAQKASEERRARAEADARRAQTARDQALGDLARIEKERAGLSDQIAAARAERDRLDTARTKQQAADQGAADARRLEAARADADRLARAREEELRQVEVAHAKAERLAHEREAEAARLETVRAEAEKLARTRIAEEKRLETVRAEAEKLARARAIEEKRLGQLRAEADQASARLARAQDAESKRLETMRGEEERLTHARNAEQKRLESLRAEAEQAAARLATARDNEQKRLASQRAEAEQAAAQLAVARDAEQKRVAALRAEADQATQELARTRLAAEQRSAAARAEAARTEELARTRDAEQKRVAALRAEAARTDEELARTRDAEQKRIAALRAEAARTDEELARARDVEQKRLRALRAEAERLTQERDAEQKRLVSLRAEAEAEARKLAAVRDAEEKRLAALRADEARAADALARARQAEDKRREDARAAADSSTEDARRAAAAEQERLAAARAEAERAVEGLARARRDEQQRLATARAEAEQAEARLGKARRAETDRSAAREQGKGEEQVARAAGEKRLAELRAEADRLARAQKEEERQLEAMRSERRKLSAEAEQLAAARAREEKRLAAERAETGRLASMRAREAARIESARAEAERLAAARAHEAERLAAERAEAEKVAAARARETERLAAERAEAEKVAAARAQETERLAAERAEAGKLAAARAQETERLAAARAEAGKLAAARVQETERLAAARAEAGKLAAARAREASELEAARAEAARLGAEQAQLRAERDAQIRQLDAARAEASRLAAERRSELASLESARRAGERTAAERDAAAERLADSRAELSRLERQLADARTAEAAGAPRHVAEATTLAPSEQGWISTPDPVRLAPPAALTRQPHTLSAVPNSVSVELRHAAHARITGVDFRDEADTERVVIAIAGDPEYSVIESPTAGAHREISAVMRLPSTDLPARLARTLDTAAFGGPVSAISTYADPEEPGSVRVVVKLAAAVAPAVRRERGRIIWEFPKASLIGKSPRRVPHSTVSGLYEPARVGGYVWNVLPLQFGAPPSAGGRGTTVGGMHHRFSGSHIDLDFKDADIHNILRLLADVGQVNIVTSDDVKGTVTIRMRDTPWDQALDVILRTKGLGQVREGNLIRVAPQAVLEKEQEAEIARQKVAVELKPLSTRLIPLSYAAGDKIIPRVQDLLSPRGKVSVDERTNMLIVSDIAGNLALAEDLIRNLDTQTPQVLIEARIVEARTTFLRDIGIQWGGSGIGSAATGNPTGIAFPNTIGVAGGNVDNVTRADGLLNGQSASPNYVVNLPATVGTGLGGALGLTFGSVAGNFNVNLRLSAAETQGTIRILSAPKITTLDNVQATIEQGTAIPISVTSAAGTNTVFIDAKLNLTVKPHVTNEGSIVMNLDITRNEPDFSKTGARGDPTILKKQAKTEMLVRDGDTAVIGGIYSRNSSTQYSKIPWLADIPVIGWFFKQRRETDDRSELLIFITPRIVNRAASIATNNK